MRVPPRTLQVGRLGIEFDIADFTPAWRQEEPETLFLLHGLCRNMSFWRPWVPRLAQHYRVIRMNSRGCGASDPGAADEPYDADALVADAFGLLDALGVGPVHWIGESSGGLVGLYAALSQPARVRSLVLVNTPLRFTSAAGSAYAAGQASHADAIRALGLAEYWRRTLANRLDTRHASQAIQDWYVREMARVPAEVAIRHLDLAFNADLSPRIGELTMPILHLLGDSSVVATKSQSDTMQSVLPGMKRMVFEGYGHGINILKPAECVEEVLRFLSDHRQPGDDVPVPGWT